MKGSTRVTHAQGAPSHCRTSLAAHLACPAPDHRITSPGNKGETRAKPRRASLSLRCHSSWPTDAKKNIYSRKKKLSPKDRKVNPY